MIHDSVLRTGCDSSLGKTSSSCETLRQFLAGSKTRANRKSFVVKPVCGAALRHFPRNLSGNMNRVFGKKKKAGPPPPSLSDASSGIGQRVDGTDGEYTPMLIRKKISNQR